MKKFSISLKNISDVADTYSFLKESFKDIRQELIKGEPDAPSDMKKQGGLP